jgi:gas vesicle protein
MDKRSKILGGVLAGVALGAVVAMILSSDKKSGLKDKINDWVCDAIDRSKDKINSFAETARTEVKKAADETASKVKV